MGFAQADAEGETARFTGWVVCAKAMREFDESLGKRWNDEVDTLLVFVSPLDRSSAVMRTHNCS
jgi:hypothetical protein